MNHYTSAALAACTLLSAGCGGTSTLAPEAETPSPSDEQRFPSQEEMLVAFAHTEGPADIANPDLNGVRYLGRAATSLDLDDTQIESLTVGNNFAAVDLAYESYGEAYQELFRRDLPVLVTLDSMLHAWHISYDESLQNLETRRLLPLLDSALESIQTNWFDCPPGSPICDSSDDVDVYISVARALLQGNRVGRSSEARNQQAVTALLEAAAAEMPTGVELYGQSREADFGQLRPIGHYDRSDDLKRWYRAVRWLELFGFTVANRGGRHPSVHRRGLMAALIATHILRSGPEWSSWAKVEDTLVGLGGKADGLSPDGVLALLDDRGWQTTEQIHSGYPRLHELAADLAGGLYGVQSLRTSVNSDKLDGRGLSRLEFHLLPARAPLDSRLLSTLVYGGTGRGSGQWSRPRPHPLDVIAAMGNTDVDPILRVDLAVPEFSKRLTRGRELADAHFKKPVPDDIHEAWLRLITSLNPDSLIALPKDLDTEFWRARRLHTQLTSWTQLRHDNVLFVPPVFGGVSMCEFPDVYVDPYPGAFRQLAAMSTQMHELLRDAGAAGSAAWAISRISESSLRLAAIAEDQLGGDGISPEDLAWVNSMFDARWVRGACTADLSMDGWFARLFPRPESALESDLIAAPIFIAEKSGGPPVLELATGRVHLVVSALDRPAGNTFFAGPIQSVHDSWQERPRQDSEWEAAYRAATPGMPYWEEQLWSPPQLE